MRTYLKITSPWSQLAVLLSLWIGAVILTGATAGILMRSHGIGEGASGLSQAVLDNPSSVSVLKAVQGLSSLICFLLPATVFAWVCFRYRPVWFLGFHKPDKIIFYPLALGLAFLCLPFAAWLGQVNEHIPLPASLISVEKDLDRQVEAFLKAGSPLEVVYNLLIMALIPAICEEAFFRGSMQRVLIHLFKIPWIGIFVGAIVFSALHFQFQGFLPRCFLGVLLGALYWYSGSLWVSILAHFLINGVQVVAASYYPKLVNENPSVPVYFVLVSAALVIGSLIKLKKESIMTYARVYEVGEVNEHNQFLS